MACDRLGWRCSQASLPASPEHRRRARKKSDTCDQGVGSTTRNAAQSATAGQVEAMKPSLVAILGDEQYQNGYYSDFENWRQPTFSSTASPFTSDSAEGEAADAWWKLLYAHHATLILNGHDHVYSRFAPMDPAGNVDPRHGIREFIIGIGGEALYTVIPSTPHLQAWADQYYGVMKLTLGPSGYAWDYRSAMESPTAPAGTPPTCSDSGSASCS
jgi:hypothetical protein